MGSVLKSLRVGTSYQLPLDLMGIPEATEGGGVPSLSFLYGEARHMESQPLLQLREPQWEISLAPSMRPAFPP